VKVADIRSRLIGDRAFYRTVLAVAVPIMVQNGITNFVGMLDNIMVGRVGTEQMSGIAIVNQLLFVFYIGIFGATSGAGIFAAQFFGCKDHAGVRHTFRFKMYACLLLLVAGVLIFLAFGEGLIRLYLHGESGISGTSALAETSGGSGASLFVLGASLAYGKRYLWIMLLGLPAFCVEQVYSSTLRECGETKVPMKAGVAAVLVNLALNYLLIFGSLGFPKLGVEGAAVATVISRLVQLSIVVFWAHRHQTAMPFLEGVYHRLGIPGQLAKNILFRGSPLLVNELFWSAGMATIMQCYSIRGLAAVAALNISTTLSNVFQVMFLACGSAISIIVGQLLGAGKMREAKETDYKLITFAVGSCVAAGAIMALCSPLFPLLYHTTQGVKGLASQLISIAALLLPLNAFTNASYFTLRCGGKTGVTFLFDSVFLWCVNIPVAYLLSRHSTLPMVTMYLCCQLIDVVKCVIGFRLVKKGVWIQNIVKQI
jgi:putative MATE family efflux protein